MRFVAMLAVGLVAGAAACSGPAPETGEWVLYTATPGEDVSFLERAPEKLERTGRAVTATVLIVPKDPELFTDGPFAFVRQKVTFDCKEKIGFILERRGYSEDGKALVTDLGRSQGLGRDTARVGTDASGKPVCNEMLPEKDAPVFASRREAIDHAKKWLAEHPDAIDWSVKP